jgi:hypothetical protein
MSDRVRVLAATLALTAIAVGYFLVQGIPARPGPHLERGPAMTKPIAPPPLPTAHSLLAQGAVLSLTKAQTARLEALDLRWKAQVAGLEAALQHEEAAFAQFMQEAQAAGKTSLQEIQRRSAELRTMSESMRERQQLHADAVLDVLTESQRQVLAKTAASARGGA